MEREMQLDPFWGQVSGRGGFLPNYGLHMEWMREKCHVMKWGISRVSCKTTKCTSRCYWGTGRPSPHIDSASWLCYQGITFYRLFYHIQKIVCQYVFSLTNQRMMMAITTFVVKSQQVLWRWLLLVDIRICL